VGRLPAPGSEAFEHHPEANLFQQQRVIELRQQERKALSAKMATLNAHQPPHR